jgi:alpha-L-rhamnosidase
MRPTRRTVLTGAGLAATAATSPSAVLAAAGQDGPRVAALKAAQLIEPMGLHDRDVRLSWRLASAARNTRQTHYRIEVASSPRDLAAGVADLWDSGKVATDRCFDIAYAGKPLASRQRVWWRVQVWESHGGTAQSDPASWEMGLLSPSDWTAQWIAAETPGMRADREAGLYWIAAPQPAAGRKTQFRLDFTTDAEADVELLTVADQDYEAFIDGKALSLPPWPATAFGKAPAAVSPCRLPAGPHTLALSTRGGANCGMLVRVRYADGRTLRIGDAAARCAFEAPDGWTQPGFDDRGWQSAQKDEDRGQPLPGNGAFLVRRDFSLPDKVRKARLYVSALGAYEAYINGRRVGDDLLAPESTDFRKRVRYRVHDVTTYLRAGANTLGGFIGDGWYGSYSAPLGRFAWGDPPLRFIAQLEITYVDGRTERVVTDPQWRISPGPITRCEIYDGEDYDARLEPPGWSEPGFNPGRPWLPAEAIAGPTGRLVGAATPPIRAKQVLKPVAIQKVGDDYVVDFGQNFAGWARIGAKGEAGRVITLRYAELVNADGSVDQSNLRAARATDTYTLRGDPAGERYEPRFTYHGFRYVQISGLAAPPGAGDISGISIHTDLAETGHLRIGNPLIQQLWRNSLWSQRSNFMGIPTDCPQRDERLGWMGDANVFWDAASFNMDTAAFTERWTADIRDAQYGNGAYADVSPNTLRKLVPDEASPGWADAGVILPWTAWKRFGDTAVIDQNWAAMVRYIDYIQANSDDHIWNRGHGWDFGDWLSYDGKTPDDPTTPKDLIGTAMAKRSVDAMADMAKATGRTDAARTYGALAQNIQTAFASRFIKPDGSVGNDSQTGYILALAYNLVPPSLARASAQKLDDNIKRRGDMLTTGFLGTPASLDVLANAGFDATVYDLLLRTGYPSWGHMIMKGATTTWERWNGDAGDRSMNSFNHYALGAVIGFVYRRIAGIEPLEPGFRRFRVKPVLDVRVPTGGADYDSISGRIATDWSYDRTGAFSLRLAVPTNTTAEVHLPAGAGTAIREGGRPVSGRPDLKILPRQPESVVLEVGSGQYAFSSRGH